MNVFNRPFSEWLGLILDQVGLQEGFDDRIRELDALVLRTVNGDDLVNRHSSMHGGEELLIDCVQTLEQVSVTQ